VHKRNLDHLTIWHNVGTDVEHGEWAIAGARLGTYRTMLTNWDYREVQSFDALESIWTEVKNSNPLELAEDLSLLLHQQLDLPQNILSPEHSKFFKYHYRGNWQNRGVMIREIDRLQK